MKTERHLELRLDEHDFHDNRLSEERNIRSSNMDDRMFDRSWIQRPVFDYEFETYESFLNRTQS